MSRRIRLSRSNLLCIVLAAGSASRLFAQSADPAVSVLPPRALPTQVLPAFSGGLIPSETSPIAPVAGPVTGQLQRMPLGEPIPQAGDANGKLATPTTTNGQSSPKIDWPIVNYGPVLPQHLPQHMPSPMWRWFGYGGVNIPETPASASSAPRASILPMPTPVTTPPTGTSNPPAPTGPELNFGIDIRPPNPVPAIPAGDVGPPPISPTPGALSPPIADGVIGRQQQRYPLNASNSTETDAWSRMATLSAPTSVPEATPASAVRTVAYQVAAPATAPVASMIPTVRRAIERASAGRGRDLELIPNGRTSLLVRLKVRQSSDAELLANVIARLPELEPYQVLFEMQIAR